VADPSLRVGGSLRGDVDGDGTSDEVFIQHAPGADPACTYFVAVRTAGTVLSSPIEQAEGGTSLGLPALDSLAQVDGRPGLDVVVTVLAGASTTFYGIFSAGSGRLARMGVTGASDFGPLFPSGGSAGHLEASDCTPDGMVVVQATPSGSGWAVKRSFYKTRGDVFEFDHAANQTDVPSTRVSTLPEFKATPFGSCPATP
jgi:hypothetical protein